MYINVKRCIGCNACSAACQQENDLALGMAWSRVYGTEGPGYQSGDVRQLPIFCQQCSGAACMAMCISLGYNAIVRRSDGILYVDANRCVGCQKCVGVCRFKSMFFNTATGKAEKCHYCKHRIDAGLTPACVITCIGHAREFGSPAEILAKHPAAVQMWPHNSNVLYENMGEVPTSRDGTTAGHPGSADCHE